MLQRLYKNGELFSSDCHRDSLKRFYENWYRTSDKNANPDFWEGILIKSNRHPLKSLRAF